MELYNRAKFPTIGDYEQKLNRGLQASLRDFSSKAKSISDVEEISKLAVEILKSYCRSVEKHYNEIMLPSLSGKAGQHLFEQSKNRVLTRANREISCSLQTISAKSNQVSDTELATQLPNFEFLPLRRDIELH